MALRHACGDCAASGGSVRHIGLRGCATSTQPPLPVFRAIEFIADLAGGGGGAILLLTVGRDFQSHENKPRASAGRNHAGRRTTRRYREDFYLPRRPYKNDLSVATFESTFHGLFPLFSAGSNGQSFPSGHAATAIGLAVALSILYPRGRWFFALLAVTVAACRVIVHAHFPTDVVAGLMLGGASAYACQRGFAVAHVRLVRMRKLIAQSLDGANSD